MPPLLTFYYLCQSFHLELMEMLRDYYYPDHIGSSSWITDGNGEAIQHLHYLHFGEDWVDQRNSSWNAPYTFSGKEKDTETGYGYFGARYYDSGLSIWLSVDPMSDKYPNMSPYNYCENNPVILVDPDGREVFLLGELAMTAFNQLVNYSSNLNLSIDKKTGKISATIKDGADLTDNEKHLFDAITNKDTKVRIQTVKIGKGRSTFDIDAGGGLIGIGGSFLGTTLEQYGSEYKASSLNMVEPFLLAKMDKNHGCAIGQNLVHEITEGFEACKITLKEKKPIHAAVPGFNNLNYHKSHDRATPQSQWSNLQLQFFEKMNPIIQSIRTNMPTHQIKLF